MSLNNNLKIVRYCAPKKCCLISDFVVPLLVNIHDGNEVDDFRPITLLNTDLKIWASILTSRLQSAVDILISHE